MIASSDDGNYVTARISFIRVTSLLDDPTDTEAAAAMYLEELTESFALNYPVFVLSADPVGDDELSRDEIEYNFVVLIERSDLDHINADDDQSYHLV